MDATLNRIEERAVQPTAGDINTRETFYTRFGKRLLDIVLAITGIVVFLPVNLILMICTYFDVGRPIIFKQERPGKGGKLFTIYKFRNMTNQTDEGGVLLDPELRVTKFGRFVRLTSLDELLQFWNILKGDMSVIGPRPLLKEYLLVYMPWEACRLKVRPGLELPTPKPSDHYWTWQSRFENDIWYVQNISFRTDVWLFFRLIQSVFNKNDVKIRSTATLVDYSMSDRLARLEADEINGCDLRKYKQANSPASAELESQPPKQKKVKAAL